MSDLTTKVRERVPHFGRTDADLLLHAITYAGTRDDPRPRWAAVRDLFAVGSTVASLLCEAAGLDPDEIVGVDDEEEPDDGDTCWSCDDDPCTCLEPDPDPEPGTWAWERLHGCMDCGVCDDCIERSRAHFEEHDGESP